MGNTPKFTGYKRLLVLILLKIIDWSQKVRPPSVDESREVLELRKMVK